jgi:antitoxin HicB
MDEFETLSYPARIEPAMGGFILSFRDIPEAVSPGTTMKEAREMALCALAEAFNAYVDELRTIPMPSEPLEGEILITIPEETTAVILKLNVRIATGSSSLH